MSLHVFRWHFLVFLLAFLEKIEGDYRINGCDLAKKFYYLGETKEDIQHWICIASHASGMNFRKINGLKFGLFQIESEWCSLTSSPGGRCNIPCYGLASNNIQQQVTCAQLKRNVACYWSWNEWLDHCHGKTLPFIDYCFK